MLFTTGIDKNIYYLTEKFPESNKELTVITVGSCIYDDTITTL